MGVGLGEVDDDHEKHNDEKDGLEKPERDALDVLIEQERKLLDLYDARASSAEARGAAALTAATAVAVLTVTVANSHQHLTRVLAAVALAALAFVVAIAVLARSGAGLKVSLGSRRTPTPSKAQPESAEQSDQVPQHESSKAPWLSMESDKYRSALRDMRKLEDQVLDTPDTGMSAATQARARALELWRARAENAHELAKKRDIWSGAAGLLFVVALGLLAVSEAVAVLS